MPQKLLYIVAQPETDACGKEVVVEAVHGSTVDGGEVMNASVYAAVQQPRWRDIARNQKTRNKAVEWVASWVHGWHTLPRRKPIHVFDAFRAHALEEIVMDGREDQGILSLIHI